MKKKFDILIQARLTSRRLPNKVIKKIGNRTALKMLLDRLKKIKFINNTVIILPNNKKNNFLNNYVKKLGYKTFRGSENNVLDRYYKASKKFKSTNIAFIKSIYAPKKDLLTSGSFKSSSPDPSNLFSPVTNT